MTRDDQCPDPTQDWLGYCLWLEMHACQACGGVGEDVDDGVAWSCPRCEGSGLDPDHVAAPEGDVDEGGGS